MTAVKLSIEVNPFADVRSSHNSYAEWREGKLVQRLNPQLGFSSQVETVHMKFREHILNSDFSCIGAKAAINGNCYRFGFYEQMNALLTTKALAHDLWEYVRELPKFKTDYATFVATFALPATRNEIEWEKLLWAQLQNLHELDQNFHNWDSTVSSNPDSPDFSFSFAETAFFIVGLHPASSRLSRRFPWVTLVFNARSQFERLREKNKFERMRQMIRLREMNLQGSLNPNLSDFGDQSEARQYSGRAVEENWRCPFHVQSTSNQNSAS